MVGIRIQKIRKSKGLTQKAFAKPLKISQNYLSQIESGQRGPSIELLCSIKSRYGISLDWLLTGKGQSPFAEAKENLPISVPELKIIALDEARKRFEKNDRVEDFVPVPLLSDRAAAGQPAYIDESDIEGYAVIYRSWVRNEKMHTAVRIRGDSMGPLLMDGYIVGIDHTQTDPNKLNNKIVAARYEDGVTIKYFCHDKHCWILYSSNRHYPPIHIRKQDGPSPVIGKVVWWWGMQK